MARLPRNAKFETRAARARLVSQPQVYWRQIHQGLFIGYRKGKTAGVWIARHLVGGKYQQAVIGKADDFQDADGQVYLDYRQAIEKVPTPISLIAFLNYCLHTAEWLEK